MNKFSYAVIAGTFFAAAFISPATAAINLVDASSINGANVLFNAADQLGTTVYGLTKKVGGTQVQFTGTTIDNGTTLRATGGQAGGVSGPLDLSTRNPNDIIPLKSLVFSLVGGNTLNNLEFNLFGGDATSVSFALVDNLGAEHTWLNQALGNGSNFFGFQGVGNSIKQVSMSFNGGGIHDFQQLRLDEVVKSAVPEPATWAMMLIGFGAVGAAMRRRKNVRVSFA